MIHRILIVTWFLTMGLHFLYVPRGSIFLGSFLLLHAGVSCFSHRARVRKYLIKFYGLED